MRERLAEEEKPELKVIDNKEILLDEEVYILDKEAHGLEEEANVKSRPSVEPDIVDIVVDDEVVMDIEENWGVGKGMKASLVGWLIISLLIMGGAMTLLLVSKKGREFEIADQPLLGNEFGTVQDEREEVNPAELVNALFENLSGYFAAESVSEKLRFVRHPDRVKNLMGDHYGRNEMKPKKLVKILSQAPVTLDFRFYNAIYVEMDDGSREPVLVELLDNGDSKVDWEGHVCYLPVPWDEYIKKRPIGNFLMRVYAQNIDYYAYDFSDDEKYTSYKLTTRDYDGYLYAYALNNTEAGKKMNDYMNSLVRKARWKQQAIFLEVSFPEDSVGLNQLVIHDLAARSWLYSKPLTKIKRE